MNQIDNAAPEDVAPSQDIHFEFLLRASNGRETAFKIQGAFDLPAALIPGEYPAMVDTQFTKVFDLTMRNAAVTRMNKFLKDWWKQQEQKLVEAKPATAVPQTFADLANRANRAGQGIDMASLARQAA